jgi:outer membrane protein TolC
MISRTVFFVVLTGLAVTGFVPSVLGQTAKPLTLQASIDLAQGQSPAAVSARLAFVQSYWSYRGSRSQVLPTVFLSADGPGLRRSIEELDQDDGTVEYVERNSTSGQARLSISQPILWTGGQLFVSSRLSRLNNRFANTDFTQWQSAPLVLALSQPIFQFNQLKWDRRTEPLRYEVARRELRADLEDIAIDITRRFFAVYISQMNLEIATFNVAINDTIYTLSQGRFEIGKIAENDLLQSELALLNAQSEQSSASIAYDAAVQDLKLALDLPYDAALEILPPARIPDLRVDPNKAVEQSRRNRPAYLDLDLDAVEARREVARARRNNGFSANLTASYGLNQSSDIFDRVYRDPLSQQQLTLSLQVPILQWGQGKAQVEAAQARRQQVEQDSDVRRKELDQEVYFEALQQMQLQQQVRIAAKADTVATRRFEVAKNRYLIGKIDITELFNAQREKDNARRSYIESLRQFWTSYFNLRRLTLFDFLSGTTIEVVE